MLVFVFPGYTLLAVFFPKKDALSGLERTGLSIGLSVACVAIFCFILSILSATIKITLLIFIAFIVITAGVALYRRTRIPVEERLEPRLKLRWLARYGRKGEAVFGVIAALILIVAVGGVAEAVASVKMTDRFTEFYVTENMKAIETTLELRTNDPLTLTLTVANHEDAVVAYAVDWDSEDGMAVISNEYQQGETFELDDGEKWERDITILPTETGTGKRLTFYLDTGEAEAYRMLSLLANVME